MSSCKPSFMLGHGETNFKRCNITRKSKATSCNNTIFNLSITRNCAFIFCLRRNISDRCHSLFLSWKAVSEIDSFKTPQTLSSTYSLEQELETCTFALWVMLPSCFTVSMLKALRMSSILLSLHHEIVLFLDNLIYSWRENLHPFSMRTPFTRSIAFGKSLGSSCIKIFFIMDRSYLILGIRSLRENLHLLLTNILTIKHHDRQTVTYFNPACGSAALWRPRYQSSR